MVKQNWLSAFAVLVVGTFFSGRCLTAQDNVITISSASSFESDEGEGGEAGAVQVGFSFGGPGSMISFGSGAENPNDAATLASLLQMDRIRTELQITDSQLEGIRKLQAQSNQLINAAVQEVMKAVKEGGERPDIDHLREARENVRKLTDRAIEEILLPEQMTRIREIAFQVEITKMGLGPALTRGKFGEEVGVRPDQKPELIRLAKEIEAGMEEKIAKIKQEARDELLAVLDKEQQGKAKELIGKYFDYKAPTLDDMAKQMTEQFKKTKEAKEGQETKEKDQGKD